MKSFFLFQSIAFPAFCLYRVVLLITFFARIYGLTVRLRKLSVVDSLKHSVELVSMFAICMSHLAS